MSDTNTTAANTNTNATDSKVAGSKKARTTNARVDFTKIIAAHAKRRGIDTTRAGKEVRAKARREFDRLVKLDPSLLKAKTHANDGNRWPPLNANAAKHILTPAKRK